MSDKPRDPLLIAAKVIVVFAEVVIVIGITALFIGLGAVLTVKNAEFMSELASTGAPAHGLWFIVAAMVTGIGLLMLGHRFFRELRGIIDSVGNGDPFAPENADRLSRMGWIAVAAQALIIVMGGIVLWLAPYAEKAGEHIKIDGGLDGGSILLTLILFILARVFRQGARMREDLEGTV